MEEHHRISNEMIQEISEKLEEENKKKTDNHSGSFISKNAVTVYQSPIIKTEKTNKRAGTGRIDYLFSTHSQLSVSFNHLKL